MEVFQTAHVQPLLRASKLTRSPSCIMPFPSTREGDAGPAPPLPFGSAPQKKRGGGGGGDGMTDRKTVLHLNLDVRQKGGPATYSGK